jgi:hypothetical protein
MTDAFLEGRRAAAAAAWNLDCGVVLVAAGDEIPVPGRADRSYPFRVHSEYLYLADRERPGGVLAYAPADGWVEFVAPVSADELLWSGLEGDREGVPGGTRPPGELEAWIAARPVRRLGAAADADSELRDALIHVRRPKDDVGRDGVDWERVDELHGFGGVRLEQNVLITDDGCEILTAAVPLLGAPTTAG